MGCVPWAFGGRARRTDSIPSSSDCCVMQMQRDIVGQCGGGGSKPGARTTLGARNTCWLRVRTPATDLGCCTGGRRGVLEGLWGRGREEGDTKTCLNTIPHARLLLLLCLNRVVHIALTETEPPKNPRFSCGGIHSC